MKRLALAMLVIASTIALPSPVAAGSYSCAFDPSTRTVFAVLTGDTGPGIWRDATGRIIFAGAWCDGATVNNTDAINVTGDTEAQELIVQLANGGFKPGHTNEPGSSDEIEFTVNLGTGSRNSLSIVGTDGANKIDFGQNNTQFGIVRKANLNAGESTGVDSDVTIINVGKVTVVGNGGNDVIRARGKAGTGPDAFGIAMWVYGGPGDDVIKGGEAADTLFGDLGTDKIWGFGNDDIITLNEGTNGDVGYGGAGADMGFYDSGDSWTQ